MDNLDSELFSHYIIKNYDITSETVSIVMTSCNRSNQTYFTLQSMLKSKCKDIHIIIVDDSDNDPLSIDRLKDFPYYIDLIVIKRENKNWVNPVVNYNIGFKFIKGSKVVIQNAEVCHIGDPLNFINTSMVKDFYYVFDVKASLNFRTNQKIYNSNLNDIEIYNKKFFKMWYHHHKHNNTNYHFFTAFTKETFEKIKEFSYDYTLGRDYDDNDFLLKIISQNIIITNIKSEENLMGGIHLFHTCSENKEKITPWNKNIFEEKENFWNKDKIYLDFYKNG